MPLIAQPYEVRDLDGVNYTAHVAVALVVSASDGKEVERAVIADAQSFRPGTDRGQVKLVGSVLTITTS